MGNPFRSIPLWLLAATLLVHGETVAATPSSCVMLHHRDQAAAGGTAGHAKRGKPRKPATECRQCGKPRAGGSPTGKTASRRAPTEAQAGPSLGPTPAFGEVPAGAITPPPYGGSGFGSPDMPAPANGPRTPPKPVR
jgi:hypothetical protein